MIEDWLQMISDCEARVSQMSEWECNFIDSISEQLARTNSLSPKQSDTLDKIWEKVTERG